MRNGGATQQRAVGGPLATFADCDALEAWVAGAEAEQGTVYATGPALIQSHPVVRLVRVLVDRGVLRTHVISRGVGRGFDYVAFKRAAETVRPCAPGRGETKLAKVLTALTKRAAAGGVMQSNAELARECGLKNADAARYQIAKLEARGVIQVEDFGPNERRRVTIAATGDSTKRGRL